jgi:drug/metabolite transporter (DMT)-like permease
MAVLLALMSAVTFGLSDFVGGLAGRRAPAWSVAVLVQAACAVSAAAVALFGTGSPTAGDLAWSALAGVGSGTGVGFLFRGLSGGRMTVVAPLSAVGSALIPVAAGMAVGERPGLLVGVGLATALPGIWLVARSGSSGQQADTGSAGSGALDGVLAGAGFGVLFAALAQVHPGVGWWPLTLTQVVSMVSTALLATSLRAAWRPRRASWWGFPAGPLSTAAVVSFQLATQRGMLTVSSVLASLYPAVTVLLAVLVLRERVRRGQAAGLLLCGATVTLVAPG